MFSPRPWIAPLAASCWAIMLVPFAAGEEVDFSRDIRPILSNNCFKCHGPDEASRQSELRLDVKDRALAALETEGHAIVPGDSAASVLYQRISADDPDERMPPADSGKQLTDEQIALLKTWIDQGADWREHWSFVRPERPRLPDVGDSDWPRNAIDHFILARLNKEGLRPSPEADKTTLLRRLTQDLTGLPPTLAEIDAFLADESPDAYEKAVDRLLASPHYGEHMARYWLDAARYGDTHGLHLDNERVIWRYRDWVINAFNRNLPFDQFTVEQLAGDLLPEATLDQLIATGFNRCNVTTSEGGSIDDEYYVRYAVDRVETTSTVWMGLTAGCAVCHEHKFDPISQKEFYELFAFFYNLTEKAMDGNAKAPPPVIKAPTSEQAVLLARSDADIAAAQARLDAPLPEVDAAQAQWEKQWQDKSVGQWSVLEPVEFTSTGGATLEKLEDHSVLAKGENPDRDTYEIVAHTDLSGITAIRLEALTHESLPNKGPGRAENSNFVLSEIEIEAASLTDPSQKQAVTLALAQADYSQTEGGYLVEKAIDGQIDNTNGWAVNGDKKHENRTAIFSASEPIGFDGGTELIIRLRHQSQFKQHAIGRFRLAVSQDETLLPARLGPWHLVGPFEATDGSHGFETDFGPEAHVDLGQSFAEGKLAWAGRDDFVDGEVHHLSGGTSVTYLYREIETPSERTLTLALGSDDGIKIWLNGNVIHAKNDQRLVAPDTDTATVDLQPGVNRLLMKIVNHGGGYGFYFRVADEDLGDTALTIAPVLATAPDERSDQQQRALREYYRARHAPEWVGWKNELSQLEQSRRDLDAQVPTTMIMQERDEPRDAFVLIRGEYDKPGEKVSPGVPSALPPLPADAGQDRLALARWLVDPAHPLTSRVTVNRYWQHYFGTGLVKTAEDFGSQGEWPSHPQLLDWLAVEFVESGWDVKAVGRLIVTSATYRQSSALGDELIRRDPQNRLLARGPRFRLDAEAVRDAALAVSGLLVREIGGASVKPYQPPGVWEAVGYTSSNTARFKQDEGDALYRRSLYTFWKRTASPPTMSIFDAPSRESCTVRRARTNTPLQALVLMNDVQFVEAARRFGQRMMTEAGESKTERVVFAFRLATARRPSELERDAIVELFDQQLAEFQTDRDAADQLIRVGDSPPDESLDSAELAAWTTVASVILNLDETVTKE